MIQRVKIPYFPVGLRYSTPFILIGALYLAYATFVVWSVLLVLVCGVVLTTRYVTEINKDQSSYHDYISLLGFRISEESGHFTHADKIVITKGSYAQNVQTRVQSRTMQWSDYTATLVMDNSKTLDLLTHVNKTELVKGIFVFATFLDVDVEDCTTSEPFIVDIHAIASGHHNEKNQPV